MTDDLVKRLREAAGRPESRKLTPKEMHEAADEIERLRKALEPFVFRVPNSALNGDRDDMDLVATTGIELGAFRRARDAYMTNAVSQEEGP